MEKIFTLDFFDKFMQVQFGEYRQEFLEKKWYDWYKEILEELAKSINDELKEYKPYVCITKMPYCVFQMKLSYPSSQVLALLIYFLMHADCVHVHLKEGEPTFSIVLADIKTYIKGWERVLLKVPDVNDIYDKIEEIKKEYNEWVDTYKKEYYLNEDCLSNV